MVTNKYHNRITYRNNLRFQSAYEAEYYTRLLSLLQAGVIRDLQLQVRFPLMVNGEKIGTYVADFTYFDEQDIYHIIDAKGYRTATYKLKAAILKANGIVIEEV